MKTAKVEFNMLFLKKETKGDLMIFRRFISLELHFTETKLFCILVQT